MASVNLTDPINLLPMVMDEVIVLFFVIYSSRARKFTPNEFVIWLRNGMIRKIEVGGIGWLYPIIDQIIVISTAIQLLEIKLELFDYQQANDKLILDIAINWRVIRPEEFFRNLFSNINNNTSYDSLIQLFKSELRDMFAEKNIDTILRRSRDLISELKEKMNDKVEVYGIIVESLEIENVVKN